MARELPAIILLRVLCAAKPIMIPTTPAPVKRATERLCRLGMLKIIVMIPVE
jgi:hypothetical protein